MRVLLSTYGSRGDVQPLAAMALALRAHGVEAVVSAPGDAEFVELLDRAGVEIAPAFMPIRDWIEWAKGSGLGIPGFAARMVPEQFQSLRSAAEGCDAILATALFPSVAAARIVAETLDIPFAHVTFSPTNLPSPSHPPVARPGAPHPPGAQDNAALWAADAVAMDQLFAGAINGLRTAVGLAPLTQVRDYVFTPCPLLATDPVLSPWQDSHLGKAIQTGAWVLKDERPLPDAVETFLAAGPAPVYVGFGSMVMLGAPEAAKIAIASARANGRRIILASGWAGLSVVDDGPDCLAVGDLNHQALFPRMAAIVHHGGAGTTTTATRAGVPQVIVPQLVDQPYFAARVAELGVGFAHNGPVPTIQSLSAALTAALSSSMAETAERVGTMLRDDGAHQGARRIIDMVKA